MNPDTIGEVKLRLDLVGLLVVAVIVLSTAFCFAESDWAERLKFFLTLSGGAVAVYGAYYASMSVKQSISRSLTQRSFELIDKLSEVDYVGVRWFIQNEIQDHTYETNNRDERLAEIQQKINGDHDLYAKVHHLLGFIESMSEQIQVGFVDERILYEHCYYIVLNGYRNLRDYIDKQRERSSDASELYMHVERLYDSWKDGKSLQTGDRILRVASA